MALLGLLMVIHLNVYGGAVPGTTFRSTAVLPIDSGTISPTVASISVFGWPVFLSGHNNTPFVLLPFIAFLYLLFTLLARSALKYFAFLNLSENFISKSVKGCVC